MEKKATVSGQGIGNGQMNLTYGKAYIVLEENDKMVKIYNDRNELQWYFKARFTIL